MGGIPSIWRLESDLLSLEGTSEWRRLSITGEWGGVCEIKLERRVGIWSEDKLVSAQFLFPKT